MNIEEESALLTELVMLVGKGNSDEAVDLLADKVYRANSSVEHLVLDLSVMVIHLADALSRAARDLSETEAAVHTVN